MTLLYTKTKQKVCFLWNNAIIDLTQSFSGDASSSETGGCVLTCQIFPPSNSALFLSASIWLLPTKHSLVFINRSQYYLSRNSRYFILFIYFSETYISLVQCSKPSRFLQPRYLRERAWSYVRMRQFEFIGLIFDVLFW